MKDTRSFLSLISLCGFSNDLTTGPDPQRSQERNAILGLDGPLAIEVSSIEDQHVVEASELTRSESPQSDSDVALGSLPVLQVRLHHSEIAQELA